MARPRSPANAEATRSKAPRPPSSVGVPPAIQRSSTGRSGRLHAAPVATLAPPGGVGVGGQPQEADAPVTQRDEVVDGHAAALLVVDDDRPMHPAGAPIDQHEGDAALGQLGHEVVVQRGEGDHQPVQPTVADEALVDLADVDDALPLGHDHVGLDHHDQLAGGRGGRLDAVGDVGEAQVVEAGDDQPDGVGASRAQAAGERVGAIAQLLGGAQDALAGLRPDLLTGVTSQHPRHGRGIDLGGTRDILEVGQDHSLRVGGAAACRAAARRLAGHAPRQLTSQGGVW